MPETQVEYDDKFKFVWIVMSEFSDSGQRGAPSVVFSRREDATSWASKEGISANIYRFPLDISLVEYSEPINGGQPYILKHHDKSGRKYRSGIAYLGFIPHEHV